MYTQKMYVDRHFVLRMIYPILFGKPYSCTCAKKIKQSDCIIIIIWNNISMYLDQIYCNKNVRAHKTSTSVGGD